VVRIRSRWGRVAHPRGAYEKGELHIVPLARQAVTILRELKALTSFG
jgi:hypothetical protein